MLPFNPGNDK